MSDLTQVLLGFDARRRIVENTVPAQDEAIPVGIDPDVCWSFIHSKKELLCSTYITPLFLFPTEDILYDQLDVWGLGNDNELVMCAFTILTTHLPRFLVEHKVANPSISFAPKDYYCQYDGMRLLFEKGYSFQGFDIADAFFFSSCYTMTETKQIERYILLNNEAAAGHQCELIDKEEPNHAPFFAFGVWTKEANGKS